MLDNIRGVLIKLQSNVLGNVFHISQLNEIHVGQNEVVRVVRDGVNLNNGNDALPPLYPMMDAVVYIPGLEIIVLKMASFGPPMHHGQKISSRLAILYDSKPSWFRSIKVKLGCDIYSSNDMALSFGNVVTVRRGGCSFQEKVEFAQLAGAIGVIVLSNNKKPMSMTLSKVDEHGLDPIKIPVMFAPKKESELLTQHIPLISDIRIIAVESDIIEGVNPERINIWGKSVLNFELVQRSKERNDREAIHDDFKSGVLQKGGLLMCLRYCFVFQTCC